MRGNKQNHVLIFRSIFLLFLAVWLLSGCSGTGETIGPASYQAAQKLLGNPNQDIDNEAFMDQLYESRTWVPPGALSLDPVELGKHAEIPIQDEGVKLLGPSENDALRSLALKIWLIEHAEHTIDLAHYIFQSDLAGEAVLGALCNAVQRGVDIRFMVDSIGSISLPNRKMMALASCARNAGYMRDAQGRLTMHKARVQALIFNSMTKTLGWINRRSHDKLLVIDAAFPDRATVITGGRNISLDYYGIREDGSKDPNAYRDMEMLLRHGSKDSTAGLTVGNTSEIYYSLLFLYRGNKRVIPVYPEYSEDYVFFPDNPFVGDRLRAQQSLEKLKSFPEIRQRLSDMPEYIATGFYKLEGATGT
jgi:hypothetical protein